MPQQPDLVEYTVAEPPIPCDFKVGEQVTYTNEYGVSFDQVVVGFTPTLDPNDDNPRFIYLDTSAWWWPVAASSLRKRTIMGGEW